MRTKALKKSYEQKGKNNVVNKSHGWNCELIMWTIVLNKVVSKLFFKKLWKKGCQQKLAANNSFEQKLQRKALNKAFEQSLFNKTKFVASRLWTKLVNSVCLTKQNLKPLTLLITF